MARCLILDPEHKILVDEATGGVPEVAGARSLAAVEAVLAARGLEVPHPAGSRESGEGGGARDFVFVVAGGTAAPAGHTWVRFAEHPEQVRAPGHADWLWSIYVDRVLGGWDPGQRALDVFFFGSDPAMAAKLAHLVACGDKRGTAAWLRGCALEKVVLPVVGQLSVVTDGFGMPRVVIRWEETRVLRFGDADEGIARLEGEGDQSLADWRKIHQDFFAAEAARLGTGFGDDEDIWVARFAVVHAVGRLG